MIEGTDTDETPIPPPPRAYPTFPFVSRRLDTYEAVGPGLKQQDVADNRMYREVPLGPARIRIDVVNCKVGPCRHFGITTSRTVRTHRTLANETCRYIRGASRLGVRGGTRGHPGMPVKASQLSPHPVPDRDRIRTGKRALKFRDNCRVTDERQVTQRFGKDSVNLTGNQTGKRLKGNYRGRGRRVSDLSHQSVEIRTLSVTTQDLLVKFGTQDLLQVLPQGGLKLLVPKRGNVFRLYRQSGTYPLRGTGRYREGGCRAFLKTPFAWVPAVPDVVIRGAAYVPLPTIGI